MDYHRLSSHTNSLKGLDLFTAQDRRWRLYYKQNRSTLFRL